jgi:hypothetical protein
MTRIKSFQPWKCRRAFQWSGAQSTKGLFTGSDASDSLDEAVDFFVSAVASATGANQTRLRVAEPFHDCGGVEVPIRSENCVAHEPAGDVG